MEDAAVEFLLENLKQLQLHHSHLISDDAKNQIQVLETNLCLFKRLLNESRDQNRDEDWTLEQVFKQIVEVVYEAEDAVDAIVSQAAEKGVEKYFKRAFDPSTKLLIVVEQAELIGAKVKEIYDHRLIDFSSLETKGESYARTEQKNLHEDKAPAVENDTMVGLEDETEILIHYLTEKTEKLDVISIAGVAGLGKTTIARHIFCHERIAYEFPIRLWVNISSNFRRRDVFLAMLRDLNCITEDMHDKTEEEMEQTLHARLQQEKFLIVFDDMWSTGVFDELQYILPKSNTMSKILITSRLLDVCWHANHSRGPHSLRLLNEEESWTLLQLTVFGKRRKYPSDLEKLGKSITKLCHGLPLQVMLIGGILAKSVSGGETCKIWEKVYRGLQTYIGTDYRLGGCVSLCYKMLPYYLRPCFIYMGMFPEDFEIPVQKLILLWIAQGFIQQKAGITSLEEVAMDYLKELTDRKLVIIGKVSLTGRIRTCRLHDIIRDFCLYKAREYFFQEIDVPAVDYLDELELDKYRHISVNTEVMSFISLQPYGPRVRTFLHFLREETILLPDNVSFIPDSFKLLRVLDVKPIRFTRFPFYLTHLVHLRYIALSSHFKFLPEAISKMWNIQTLIVGTSSRTLEIKADIWKMNQLRHLETNASIILRKNTTGESVDDKGEKMQTLSKVSPESCAQIFERATNLKKLGIRGRGRLAMLMDHDNDGSTPFDGLSNLHRLEKLKLLNDIFANPRESQMPGLPSPYKFPPKLMSLTLSYTFLDWKHMCILGMLENLKALKLKNNAFVGECWESADNGFCQLEVLQIEYTNLVTWKASSSHFPRLKYLVLRNCEHLEALPLGLADVSSLQVIDLYRTTKSAAASAKKIQVLTEGGLRLSIFPPDEWLIPN
ncbi:Apoptotic ATPase [Handroanthus impetiginosus]|uniref:Apoptotic ATPase n=1 Tax=Handroanthus impetiginosus TaxID=429701 RepID=A0A2G9GZ16_9LAMI|nr:Apoptotic ATPase [Handroanthus impetiginosus]